MDDYLDDYLTSTCRQCLDLVRVDPDEPQPDGPFYCEACQRATVNRAAEWSSLSQHLLETAVLMGKVSRS